MDETRVSITAGGTEITDDVLVGGGTVDVEEALDEADAASVTVGVQLGGDGEWTSVVDDLTRPRAELGITISSGDRAYSFAGIVADSQWRLVVDGSSELTVKAVDRTAEMDREERVVAWPGMADSAIAEAIFSSYGFAADVQATPTGPDPDTFTPVQRATDWAFLRSLAAKWGYHAFLESEGEKVVGHFRPVDPLSPPSVTLRLGYGGDADTADVQLELDGGAKVRADRILALSEGPVTGRAQGTDLRQGEEVVDGQRSVLLGPGDVEGEVDPAEAALGRARTSAFVVQVSTAVDATRTGIFLRARRTIDVVGLGSRLSGRYLVASVRHRVSRDQHSQQVRLVRNALGAAGPALPGLP